MTEYRDALKSVIDEVVAPAALDVDRGGHFPQEAVHALGARGLLGLLTAEEYGGGGHGLRAAADVIELLARECGSTAMIVMMHFAATAVIEALGPESIRADIGAGRHLSTLAFSETGSRSYFWAPLGTATATTADPSDGEQVKLNARKSWITSATAADSYVWSSLPMAEPGPMSLWLVPSDAAGLTPRGTFDGLGLRGNGSVPVNADDVVVPLSSRLGEDGAGLDVAMAVVLPVFLVLSAAFSLGLMEAVVDETGRHVTGTRLVHIGSSLIDQPVVRADYARMRLATDTTRALLVDTLTALETGRDDAILRVLEIKAVAGEAAISVTDLAMKVCGGAAFRRDLGIERHFRDARAARVMAPTTDALLDFVGRVIGGLPLLDH